MKIHIVNDKGMKKKFNSKIAVLLVSVLTTSICNAQISTSLHQYDEMGSYFDEGLKRVSSQGKHGFIDFEGNEVIPLKYEDAFNFWNGLAPVKLNGKWGYIDHEGNEITPFKYDEALNFEDGIDIAAVIIGDYYGFINKSGEEITPFKYEVQDRACVSDIPAWRWITLESYERYNDFQSIANNMYTLKHPLMNEKTGQAYHPRFLVFHESHRFNEGLAAVSVKCPEFTRKVPKRIPISANRNMGYTTIYEDDKLQPTPICWGFIDVTGKEVIPLIYKTVAQFGDCSKENHCWVTMASKHNELYGHVYLDKLGNEYPIGVDKPQNIKNAHKAANNAMIELEKNSETKPSELKTGQKLK